MSILASGEDKIIASMLRAEAPETLYSFTIAGYRKMSPSSVVAWSIAPSMKDLDSKFAYLKLRQVLGNQGVDFTTLKRLEYRTRPFMDVDQKPQLGIEVKLRGRDNSEIYQILSVQGEIRCVRQIPETGKTTTAQLVFQP